MNLFSIQLGGEERNVLEQLIGLELARGYRERLGLLVALESQGFTVRYVRGSYEAQREGAHYRVPSRRCPRCGHVRGLWAFVSRRRAFPHEAEQARAARDARLSRGNPQAVLAAALPRCANPACPSGGTIPPEKVRKGQRFCSRRCLRLFRSGPERPCEREGCPNLLRKGQAHYCSWACRTVATYRPCQNPACPTGRLLPPGRTYCSRTCCVAHGMATGRFQRMSARGNVVQQDVRSRTGYPPHYERRAEAVRRNNSSAPPRRRVSRTGTAYGYQVLLEPEGPGYRARVPALAGVTATGRTMREAMKQMCALLRGGRAELALPCP